MMRKLSSKIIPIVLSLALAGCNSAGGGQTPLDIDFANDKIEGEITVNCFDSIMYKSFLEEAVAAFETKYPETKVHLETFGAMPEMKQMELEDGTMISVMTTGDDYEKSKQDYLSRINTEIMGGQGADIFAADVLPWYKYAESGQLADMSAYMEDDPEFNKADYFGGLLDGAKYKGGQYILPADYNFNFFAYDSSLLNNSLTEKIKDKDKLTYKELLELTKDSFVPDDKTILFDYASPLEFFNNMLNTNYEKYINLEEKKAYLNTGDFEEMLTTAKDAMDKGYLRKNVNEFDSEDMESIISSFGKTDTIKSYFKENVNFMLENFFSSQGHMVYSSSGMIPADQNNDKIGGLISDDAGNVHYKYYQAYFMNKNSQNKRTAWEFIKFLLGEEMQQSLNMIGESVNMKGAEARHNKQISGEGYEGDDLPELTPEELQAYDDYIAKLNTYSAMLNKCTPQDDTIHEMLVGEAQAFFDGTRTAKETADILQNKVELYLNE